jgi:4a-hydroxytetrahydrobiopterin dehydratase
MSELSSRQCVPCRGGVPPLEREQIENFQSQLKEWDVVDQHHLRKLYQFANFREAQVFVNKVGDLAEEQGHHPDIYFGWGKAEITIWTHKIDGLTESDFILAAKIDEIQERSTDFADYTD